ncbi:beta family protein [Streptomyces tubercidicus]
MVEPSYVPVLPTTRAARLAFSHLDARVRRRIAPLWTVVPRVGPERIRGTRPIPDPDTDPAELRSWLMPRMNSLIEVMADAQGWVDTAHVEGLLEASATSLWQLATKSSLRLVTGPERDPSQQRYIADLAFLGGRGLGLRVLLDEPPDEAQATELRSLVERLRQPPALLDLILDVGPVLDPLQSGRTALIALDLLAPLLPWRTVVLASGAFPRTSEDAPTQPFRITARHDWHLYRSVRAARPDFPRRLTYGDYSVEHVYRANIAPSRHPDSPAWGLLRYTTAESFLLARAPTRGRNHAFRARATARWIVEGGSFRGVDGTGLSAGDQWLHSCAYGDGPSGCGSPEKSGSSGVDRLDQAPQGRGVLGVVEGVGGTPRGRPGGTATW